eukprot:g11021.t1
MFMYACLFSCWRVSHCGVCCPKQGQKASKQRLWGSDMVEAIEVIRCRSSGLSSEVASRLHIHACVQKLCLAVRRSVLKRIKKRNLNGSSESIINFSTR